MRQRCERARRAAARSLVARARASARSASAASAAARRRPAGAGRSAASSLPSLRRERRLGARPASRPGRCRARRSIRIGVARLPVARDLQHRRPAQAAVGEQQVFDGSARAPCRRRSRSRPAATRPASAAKGAQAAASKVSGTSAGRGSTIAMAELARDAIAEVGGADLRDRQAAGGDRRRCRALHRAAVGVELEAAPRRRAIAALHGARLPARRRRRPRIRAAACR